MLDPVFYILWLYYQSVCLYIRTWLVFWYTLLQIPKSSLTFSQSCFGKSSGSLALSLSSSHLKGSKIFCLSDRVKTKFTEVLFCYGSLVKSISLNIQSREKKLLKMSELFFQMFRFGRFAVHGLVIL